LQSEVERLVVEAKRVGLDAEDLVEAIWAQWEKLQRRALPFRTAARTR
jgi:hypothetical protein